MSKNRSDFECLQDLVLDFATAAVPNLFGSSIGEEESTLRVRLLLLHEYIEQLREKYEGRVD